MLVGLLLASPNPPCDESEGAEDDGSTHTHDNTDDDVPRLLRHAGSATGATLGKAGGPGHGSLAGEGRGLTIGIGRGDNRRKGLRGGLFL